MSDSDRAYDRLHGLDGHTQADPICDCDYWHDEHRSHCATRLAGYVAEYVNVSPTALQARVTEAQWNALEMARKADAAERRAEEAEYHVEQLRDARDRAERHAEQLEGVLAQVKRVFDLQCPPMPVEKYVDRGAWMAHSWWNTVLGGILRRSESGGVGTGAGEGATGQDTGTAWVTRSTDCPEAPAQAHPLDDRCHNGHPFEPGIGCDSGPWGTPDPRWCDVCGEARRPDETQGCDHEWLDRPESDTRECLICGTEVSG